MPSTRDVWPFSPFLICSQLVTTAFGRLGLDIAEHVGMTAHELGVHTARHVRDPERARLGGEHGMDHHLEEQIAELVFERVPYAGRNLAAGRLDRQLVDGGRDLVRLLEHVPAQGVMGLRRVPRASTRAAQALGECEQPRELTRDRDGAGVDEHRGEMVGLDDLIELGER